MIRYPLSTDYDGAPEIPAEPAIFRTDSPSSEVKALRAFWRGTLCGAAGTVMLVGGLAAVLP